MAADELQPVEGALRAEEAVAPKEDIKAAEKRRDAGLAERESEAQPEEEKATAPAVKKTGK